MKDSYICSRLAVALITVGGTARLLLSVECREEPAADAGLLGAEELTLNTRIELSNGSSVPSKLVVFNSRRFAQSVVDFVWSMN